jgi:hypothetical protein
MNKIYLQDVEELKRKYSEDPEGFVRKIRKADALIGPEDSMLFVDGVMNTKNTADENTSDERLKEEAN